ncbi:MULTISPECIES: hypothetical protein [Methylomonas]|uniref:Uncharacterized protein n=1 Tax=Methylomonas koyamae TaxID=702114 RepID=A0A177NQQ4_9GAMM|nr:hypothetical protein [Methylomonas koyamae]OAI19633.1 hypothetical protein A1355_03795 [Methylomonas koyamae]
MCFTLFSTSTALIDVGERNAVSRVVDLRCSFTSLSSACQFDERGHLGSGVGIDELCRENGNN